MPNNEIQISLQFEISEGQRKGLRDVVVVAITNFKQHYSIAGSGPGLLFRQDMIYEPDGILIEFLDISAWGCTRAARQQLAVMLGNAVFTAFPRELVECFIHPSGPVREMVSWSSQPAHEIIPS